MVVFPPGKEFGMIVREVPKDFPGRLVPGSSLASKRPGGQEPLLVEMIRKSGMEPMDYVREKMLTPLMKTYGDITFGAGLVGEPHQQNVLFEVGKDGQLTGRVVMRDLDSYKVDVEARVRKGLSVRDLAPYSDPGIIGDLKLSKAREYYDTSYNDYVREDYGFMLSRGLGKYFPSVTEKKLHTAMDDLYRAQVKEHLGLDVTDIDPNKIQREWRAQVKETTAKPSVPQKVLAEEFDRLAFNRRALWVGDKPGPKADLTYFLHDGAIEVREGSRVLGFAFPEPQGAKKFYESIPYPRKEPNARRLESLYTNAPQDRAGSIVKSELGGAGQFAAAYLLREAFKGKNALPELKTPGFWIGTGVFTVAAKATDYGLTKLAVGGLAKTALPLAMGMAAVQVLSGHGSVKDVLIDTGSFLAAGLLVDLLADGLIYPILFAAGPPGWIAAGIYTIAKMAVTLYLGEKISGWIHGLFHHETKEQPPTHEGVKQKIDALGGIP
jgi:hypothetical protein